MFLAGSRIFFTGMLQGSLVRALTMRVGKDPLSRFDIVESAEWS